MALTADRNTPRRDGDIYEGPVAASKKLFAGAFGAFDASGNLTPGATATTLIGAGRVEELADNSAGLAGDINARVRRGVFRWENSADADAITQAEIGDPCYLVDDQTVAKTNGGGTRSPAGWVMDVDDDGVWVSSGARSDHSATGALLVANNLSDLDTPATARTQLGGGANKCLLQIADIDLVGSNTELKHIVSPVAGTIDKIYSVIDGALTSGNATLTAKINGTGITTGVITITQAGSAAGDVDVVSPSALKTVAVGDVISVLVGGTNDAQVLGQVALLITPSA